MNGINASKMTPSRGMAGTQRMQPATFQQQQPQQPPQEPGYDPATIAAFSPAQPRGEVSGQMVGMRGTIPTERPMGASAAPSGVGQQMTYAPNAPPPDVLAGAPGQPSFDPNDPRNAALAGYAMGR